LETGQHEALDVRLPLRPLGQKLRQLRFHRGWIASGRRDSDAEPVALLLLREELLQWLLEHEAQRLRRVVRGELRRRLARAGRLHPRRRRQEQLPALQPLLRLGPAGLALLRRHAQRIGEELEGQHDASMEPETAARTFGCALRP